MRLPEFSTRYPVTVSMMTVAVILLGWISFDGLGTDLLPNLQTPVVTVDLRAPGKSPQEMEERYTRRLERDISTLSGVQRVYSVTRSGQSVVVAEFTWNSDMDFALLDVQKATGAYAVDDAVESVDVAQEDPQALPVARIAVSGTTATDLDTVLGVVETVVKPKLEALAGVASAEVEGDAEKEIRITLDPYMLEAFGLSDAQIVQRIRSANQDISGGTLEDGEQAYQIKALGRLGGIGDVAALIVGERAGSTGAETAAVAGTSAAGSAGITRVPVRLGEVARIELQFRERETIVRLDGVECLGLAIYKEADASTVGVVRATLENLDTLALDLPEIEFTVVENQAAFIEQAVQEVEKAAVYGALLAVGVLLVFLRSWTVTLVIGMAIPISILATFTLMYFQDLTLNIMTLGGLALGAGMLVDNAIVVIENIYRHLEGGADPRAAASRGASEVGVAILASTITTVSVFVPIVYLHGLVGELFKEQAWTVAFSLVSSLVVAVTAVPALASRILRPRSTVSGPRQGRFRAFLAIALEHKLVVGAVIVVVLAGTVVAAREIRAEFIPRESQGLVHLDLSLPEGTRLEMTDRVARRVGQIAQEIGAGQVQSIYMRAGVDPTQVSSVGDPTGPNRATLSVTLLPEARHGVSRLVQELDSELAAIPELVVKYRLHETALEGVVGNQAAPIQVEIAGEDLATLRRLTDELAVRMEALPAVYNVSTNLQGGQPEIDLQLRDDVAAAFGLTPQSLADLLAQRLSGTEVGELSRDQRSRTLRVAYEKIDLQQLKHLRIDTADGAILTLGDLAEPRLVEGPREILRDGQRRIGRISGYLSDGAILGSAVEQVEATLSDAVLPAGYRVEIGGEERERAASFRSLGFALALSAALVYMVMASLFESLVHPFTVMLSVPLAGVGVVVAFWGLGEPLSVMAYIGIIMLGGIAVNDAIILVDHINQLRSRRDSLRQAVLDAAHDRLRPILMTSATTILALAPMAVGLGEGARLRAPMAIAVIAGLVSSTLMTLVVIPVAYEVVDRLLDTDAPVPTPGR